MIRGLTQAYKILWKHCKGIAPSSWGITDEMTFSFALKGSGILTGGEEGRRCRYFKEEGQQEKGHRRMRGNNLFVGLMIILSDWRTVPLGESW